MRFRKRLLCKKSLHLSKLLALNRKLAKPRLRKQNKRDLERMYTSSKVGVSSLNESNLVIISFCDNLDFLLQEVFFSRDTCDSSC